jgi:hypothetical protein
VSRVGSKTENPKIHGDPLTPKKITGNMRSGVRTTQKKFPHMEKYGGILYHQNGEKNT